MGHFIYKYLLRHWKKAFSSKKAQIWSRPDFSIWGKYFSGLNFIFLSYLCGVLDISWCSAEDQSTEHQLHFCRWGTGVIFFGHIGHQYRIVSYRWQILWVDGTSGPTRQCSGVGSVPRSSILPSCWALPLWAQRAWKGSKSASESIGRRC